MSVIKWNEKQETETEREREHSVGKHVTTLIKRMNKKGKEREQKC